VDDVEDVTLVEHGRSPKQVSEGKGYENGYAVKSSKDDDD
jgi:hypothetical protein